MSNLTKDNLLSLILSWYADHDNWVFNIQGKSKANIDGGRLARSAIDAKSVGALIVILCNSIDISISVIATKCNIPMPRMVSLIQKNDMTEDESKVIWNILHMEYRKFYKLS